MARILLVLFLGAALLPGCATTSSPGSMALENRVQSLENRLSVLEADRSVTAAPTRVASMATLSQEDSTSSAASASEMTKEEIQQALKNAGYYSGTVDGKIGPQTRAAIRQFQDDMGLKVDGVAGRMTKEKLFKYLR